MRRIRGIILSMALAALAACGSPDGPGGPADGAPTTPDSGADGGAIAVEYSGTISLLETTLTNPGLEGVGAVVDIDYYLDSSPDPDPVFGDPSQIGQCAVWHHDDSAPEPRPIDIGDVVITGTASPVGTCAIDMAAARYRCPLASGAIPVDSSAQSDGADRVTITLLGDPAPFTDLDLVASHVDIAGFSDPVYNGRFAVVDHDERNLLAYNPVAAGHPRGEAGAAASYAAYAGEGPAPTVSRALFRDDGTAIVVHKLAGPSSAEWMTEIDPPPGPGPMLDPTSHVPHGFPASPAAMTFSCANGDCGPPGGIAEAFVLIGRTTDADLAGASPIDMPAGDRYAVFRCMGIPGQPALEVSADAVAAILQTDPTRVEMHLMRIIADQNLPRSTLVVGHSLLGYTDMPTPVAR